MEEAQEIHRIKATRFWQKQRRWLLALLPLLAVVMILALTNWRPVAAQSTTTAASDANTPAQEPSNPTTVVLPNLQIRFPFIRGEAQNVVGCPTTSINSYESLEVNQQHEHEPAPPLDPDLNLQMRGYVRTTGGLDLIAIGGPTDEDAPQLAYLFRPVRVPAFTALYKVRDWNWSCCPGGKAGEPLEKPDVTLVEMATTPGEAIYPPRRNNHIGGDHVALVLYAEEFRITFTYTREDSPAVGYLVHIENFCTDTNLLALYRQLDAEGRDELPALRFQDSIGSTPGNSVMVAVRDTGSFMDPRSGKDWWQDRVRAILAARASQ